MSEHPWYRPVPETNRFELVEDIPFVAGGLTVWIPASFQFDGASIPRAVWALIGSNYDPDFLDASCAHDWAYLTHCISRADADDWFRRALLLARVPKWKAWLMYRAIRLFGASHWETTAADRQELQALRERLSVREDRQRFTRLMLAA